VIDDALDELAFPFASRSKFPAGAMPAGDGGYNFNEGRCFGNIRWKS